METDKKNIFKNVVVFVEEVRHEFLNNPVKVYNFEVEDNHTYFADEEKFVVVHNKDCGVGAYRFKIKLNDSAMKGEEVMYIGKGSVKRMKASIRSKIKYGEIVEGSVEFIPCAGDMAAFVQEAQLMHEVATKTDVKLLIVLQVLDLNMVVFQKRN